LRTKWDNFAVLYSQKLEKITNPIGLSLINTLDIENGKSILDCGSGSGLNAITLLGRKSSEATLALSDLSEVMIKRAQYRISKYILDPTS
jgi:ubiquinone/menaquinone biosynthesis C-methylase UbiE